MSLYVPLPAEAGRPAVRTGALSPTRTCSLRPRPRPRLRLRPQGQSETKPPAGRGFTPRPAGGKSLAPSGLCYALPRDRLAAEQQGRGGIGRRQPGVQARLADAQVKGVDLAVG